MKAFKLTLISLLLVLGSAISFAQNVSLRNVIAVVKPNYSESSIAFFDKFITSLKENGYTSSSEQLKASMKGGFGSGFVYNNPANGRNYLITNKHVVVQAETVTIEFMLEDQSVRAFNNCKIIAFDENTDLALIELPIEAKFEKEIKISSDKVTDGDDVYTAGYPALANKPSWQFGKGIVSNSTLKVEEISNNGATLIQHTAQIDPGSSGGPLLKKTKDGEYQVVGINTWKAKGRENVNLSIPVNYIVEFVNKQLSSEKNDTKANLESAVAELVKSKNDGYKKILPFVSYDYISHLSVDAFFQLLLHTEKEIKDEVINQFNNGFPIEGVRITIADAIAKKLLNKEVSYKSIQNFTNDGLVDVSLQYNGKEAKSSWICHYGKWMMADFPLLNLNAEWKSGLCDSYGYDTGIIVSRSMGSYGYTQIEFQRTIYTYGTYSVGGSFGSGGLGVVLNIGGELPFQISQKTYLTPFLKGFLGADLSSSNNSNTGIYSGFYAGSEIAFSIGKKSYFLVGLGFRPKFYIFELSESNTSKTSYMNFAMHAGIAF